MSAAKKKCVRGERKCRVNRKLVCADANTVCDAELRTARARVHGSNEWVRIFRWWEAIVNDNAGGDGYQGTGLLDDNGRVALLAVKVRPLAMARIPGVADVATVARATREQAALMTARLDAWYYALSYYFSTQLTDERRKQLRATTLPLAMRRAKLEAAGKRIGAPAENVQLTRRRVMQKCPAETRACHKLLCTDRNLPCAKEVTAFLRKTRREIGPTGRGITFARLLIAGKRNTDIYDMVHAAKMMMPRVKQTPADTRIARAEVLLATPAMQRDLAAVKYVYASDADKDAAKAQLQRAIVTLRAVQKQRRQAAAQ